MSQGSPFPSVLTYSPEIKLPVVFNLTGPGLFFTSVSLNLIGHYLEFAFHSHGGSLQQTLFLLLGFPAWSFSSTHRPLITVKALFLFSEG